MANKPISGLAALALAGAATSAASQAYVDCGRFQSSQDRQWCYAQQTQIYQQQSQSWNQIGNDWQQVHDYSGSIVSGLGLLLGPQFSRAARGVWEAPAYGYDAYNYWQGW